MGDEVIGSDGKGDDVIVEDWLWGDDTPEEGDEEPLTQSELALRKRMISIFVGSAITGIALIILATVTFRVFNPSSSNKLPHGCLRGKVSDCPATKKPTSYTLPGGGTISDLERDASKGAAKILLERCLDGDVAACSASNSGR